ncbi:MAG: methionine--tRNA ligase, partial [Gemmatimonadota bacterium]|nr:methionine--tRNA ligase [Gemmatimonadota bacterium]
AERSRQSKRRDAHVSDRKFYLTTAIDYANGDPHFGHALEKIGADVIARAHRQMGEAVHFLIGMDEHGQKVAQTAAARGMEPQAFVDAIAATFEAMWDRLAISRDQFIRTTDPAHKSGVRAFIKRIAESSPDDFYEKEYEGWYCVGCELFKRDDEIVDGKCVIHPTRDLQWTKERNWFFRLSKYQTFLRDLVTRRPEFIQPATRRNEILALIDSGLEDLSITRARLAWAIPFPIASPAGGEPQGTWVWFDALPNYLTATGYPGKGWRDRWPAQLHVVGKDITRLHCVVWPAMLQAAELPLPERVWAHGFISFGGERFSKSAGVKIELADEVARFGPDAFRYFLMREIPFDADGDYSAERFEAVYTSELANGLGNLASRVIAMIEKYRDGVVPRHPAPGASFPQSELDTQLLDDHRRAFEYMVSRLDGSDGFRPHLALAELAGRVGRTNAYIQNSQPWNLAKAGAERAFFLDLVLNRLARSLAWFAVHLAAFMPAKAQELWGQLGGPGDVSRVPYAEVPDIDPAGWRVTKGEGLFPRADAPGDNPKTAQKTG